MSVLSKILFAKLPYNCYETLHTWDPNCGNIRYQALVDTYSALMPLYLLLNSSSYALRYRTISREDLPKILKDILSRSNRSAAALGVMFYFVATVLCNMKPIFGFYRPVFMFIGCWAASFIGCLLEADRRLHLYVVYMSQLVSELLLAAIEDQGFKGHPLLTLAVLAGSVATQTFLFRTSGAGRTNFANFLTLVIGKPNLERIAGRDGNNNECGNNHDLHGKVSHRRTSALCSHNGELCSAFALKRSALIFGCSAGGSLLLRVVTSTPWLVGQVRKGNGFFRSLGQILFPKSTIIALQLGLGLASFCGTFNAISCYLRQREGRDVAWHSVPSSVLATIAGYVFWPSQRVAIYALCNTAYTAYMQALKDKKAPSLPYGPQLSFSFLCALMFSVGSLKPHYVRKSYVTFLNRILGNRISLVNWSAISHMGFESARVYKEELPNFLDPRCVSEEYMRTVWLWSLGDHVLKASRSGAGAVIEN